MRRPDAAPAPSLVLSLQWSPEVLWGTPRVSVFDVTRQHVQQATFIFSRARVSPPRAHGTRVSRRRLTGRAVDVPNLCDPVLLEQPA